VKLLSESARLIGLTLNEEHLRAFEIYYRELVAWNEKFNLTAITDYDQVQIKHFLDSLTCLLVVRSPRSGVRGRAIDIGAGAGFPGLPLKIVCPGLRLTLLEATGKKVGFLEHIVSCLELEGVEVIKGRAEELGRHVAHREGYDLALARAVAELPVLVEYALPFCRLGGLFVAQKGAEADAEAEAAEGAIATLGGFLRCIVHLELPYLAESRSLVVIEKIAPTPKKYPRRPGIPSKRPLQPPISNIQYLISNIQSQLVIGNSLNPPFLHSQ
jgi:16S rRNA (guanine527-N7)-methyltransferase